MFNLHLLKPFAWRIAAQAVEVKAELEITPPFDNTSEPLWAQFDDNPPRLLQGPAGALCLWVPAIGEPMRLRIRRETANSTAEIVHEQVFSPPVRGNWQAFSNGTIHILSSSHQDIAWMDTPDVCIVDRDTRTITPALAMMQHDPDYHFGMEQVLNLMEYLQRHPDRAAEIRSRFEDGRFAWGASYNQPYESLESGEQLIRQFYLGRKWIHQTFPGCDDRTYYNIDVPGRSLQMAQILQKSGVRYLAMSRFRDGLFRWFSPDGSSVVAFATGHYGWPVLQERIFADGALDALHKLSAIVDSCSDTWHRHRLAAHFAVMISDDGQEPQNFRTLIDDWNRIVAIDTRGQLPRLRHSTVEQFLDAVTADQPDLEPLSGERPNLWLYIHGPGHHRSISLKREAARLLPAAEIFNSVRAIVTGNPSDYPLEKFDRAWRSAIYPDHGWGGKNGEITDRIFHDRLQSARDEALTLLHDALSSLVGRIHCNRRNGTPLVLFNALSWQRSEPVRLSVPAAIVDCTVVDSRGEVVPSQLHTLASGENELSFIATVPSVGYATWYLGTGQPLAAPAAVQTTTNSCENDYYRLVLQDGGIHSLFDKELQRDLLLNSRFSGAEVLMLGYHGHGAGEFTRITPPSIDGMERTRGQGTTWRQVAGGVVFHTFENRSAFSTCTVVQRIILYHAIKRLDIEIEILGWDGTKNRELRMMLPLSMEKADIAYEVPLAVLRVGQDELADPSFGWSWEGAYKLTPADAHPREMQNFICASDDRFALTLSSSVSGVDWIDPTREARPNPVLQALLFASFKSCHKEGNWYTQEGDHSFRFSLYSHPRGWKNGYHRGISANHPFYTVVDPRTDSRADWPEQQSFVALDRKNILLSTLKKAQDDDRFVFRCVEMEGQSCDFRVDLCASVHHVQSCNLIEEEDHPLPQKGRTLALHCGHHAVETVKLDFS